VLHAGGLGKFLAYTFDNLLAQAELLQQGLFAPDIGLDTVCGCKTPGVPLKPSGGQWFALDPFAVNRAAGEW
jgi:hypothetical protein